MNRVLVVVPCYNEAKRLPQKTFLDFANFAPDIRFLFVNDGSTDDTLTLLNFLKTEKPDQFDILNLKQNVGKAEAIRQGFLKALQGNITHLAYWDADLATPLDTLLHFLRIFDERSKVELIMGSRVKLMGRDIKRNEIRHYLGRIFATAASFALGLGVYDTQCGAKMFKVTDSLTELIEEPFSSKWIFDVELLARFAKLKGKNEAKELIYEFPLFTWHDIAGSKLKPSDFFKALWDLIQIYRLYR